ncbi:hypothetical protein GJ496_008722 [Pomphorhynchus laevis]|nr:hypothetical protein GJ496_008722 [Pomphorhynchus laevis]
MEDSADSLVKPMIKDDLVKAVIKKSLKEELTSSKLKIAHSAIRRYTEIDFKYLYLRHLVSLKVVKTAKPPRIGQDKFIKDTMKVLLIITAKKLK